MRTAEFPVTDEVMGELLDLTEQIEKGVKWGRIPHSEAMELLRGLNERYSVEAATLDFDADPHIPDGWSVRPEDQIASRLTGSWELDISKIGLHLDTSQQGDKFIEGYELKKQLEGQKVLPAHVLDELLEHPELIPESFKDKSIFFWGTIYRGSDGMLCVRYLGWYSGGWYWDNYWLGSGWEDHEPCAVLAI